MSGDVLSDEEMGVGGSSDILSDDEMMSHGKAVPGEFETLARGGANGATFGFAPAIAGGLGASKDYLENLLDHPDKLKSFLDLYRKNRDEYHKGDVAAREANPKSYLAGEVGGTLATSLIPGVGEIGGMARAATAAKLAALGEKAGALGYEGAKLANLGLSAERAAKYAKAGVNLGENPNAITQGARGVGDFVSKLLSPSNSELAGKAVGASADLGELAAEGALSSVGNSTADLTKGEYGKALKDAKRGAMASSVLGGAGKVVGAKSAALGALADKFGMIPGMGMVSKAASLVDKFGQKAPFTTPVAVKNLTEMPVKTPDPVYVDEDEARRRFVNGE